MASNESEDGSASMEASDRDCDVNCSNGSAPMNKPKRTKSGTMFRAWSFHVTLKANEGQTGMELSCHIEGPAFIVPVVYVVITLVAPVVVIDYRVIACVFDARCGGKATVSGKGGGISMLHNFFYPCSTIDVEPLTPLPTFDTTFSSIATFIALVLAVHRLHPRLIMIQL